MDESYRVTVNGRQHRFDADPQTPLLHILRNRLGLKGSRFGCGTGSCGACVVLLDGRPTPSCDLPVWSAADKTVVTVEGLVTEQGAPHPVQQAFLDEQAGQCGYCLSGMIVSGAALFEAGQHRDPDAVAKALERHLCRCGVHQRVVRAVMRARRAGESA